MARIRISILGGMAVVALASVALAALRTASDLWFSTLYTATFVLLLVAVVAAIVRRGGERAFWCGFAVFGWGFFLLGLGPLAGRSLESGSGRGQTLNQDLLSSKAVYFLVSALRKPTDDLEEIDKITSNTLGIAHLLVTLGSGVVGGAVAFVMRRRRRGASRASSAGNVATGLVVAAGFALATAAVISISNDRRSSRYFSEAATRGGNGFSDGRVVWYSNHLRAMGEPSLAELALKDPLKTVCRLLWLPTFSHPFAVRIQESGKGAEVRVVVLDGFGGYEPGHIAVDRRFAIRDDQWREIQRRLEALRFWEMPTHIEDEQGTDGDQYIIECTRSGAYHVVDRWEPNAAYKAICATILDLSGLKYHRIDLSLQPNGTPPDQPGFHFGNAGGGMR